MQEIILGFVLLLCVIWIVRRIMLCFKRIGRKDNPCEGCPIACSKRK